MEWFMPYFFSEIRNQCIQYNQNGEIVEYWFRKNKFADWERTDSTNFGGLLARFKKQHLFTPNPPGAGAIFISTDEKHYIQYDLNTGEILEQYHNSNETEAIERISEVGGHDQAFQDAFKVSHFLQLPPPAPITNYYFLLLQWGAIFSAAMSATVLILAVLVLAKVITIAAGTLFAAGIVTAASSFGLFKASRLQLEKIVNDPLINEHGW